MTGSGRAWRIYSRYTVGSVLVLVPMMPLAILAFLDDPPLSSGTPPVAWAALVAVVLAAMVSAAWALRRWDATPTGDDRADGDLPRLGTIGPDRGLLPLGAAVAASLAVLLTTDPDPQVFVLGAVTAAVAVLFRVPALAGVIGGVAVAASFLPLGIDVVEVGQIGAIMVGFALATRATLWLAELVRELEQARAAQARLAVAEERLRFARDLHDTTGRDLSAIAVTSELVAQLAERADPRTPEQAREVAQIARTSLATTRSLVRGYREADLPTELRGTVSLLRAADVRVEVIGEAEDVDAAHAEHLAWALREGGTNVLRHASATTARIELRRDRLRMVNDGADPHTEIREGTGLTGMRERLGEHAEISVRNDRGTVTLDVALPPAGSTLERVGPRTPRSVR